MVTGNGQLRHALRERSAAAARFPHAYGGLLPARPGTPGIYFEYSRKLVTLVGLVCCFLGAFGAAEYFFVRAGGQGRPLGALLPIFYNRTHPVTVARAALRRVRLSLFEVKSRIRAASALISVFLPRTARPAPLRDARRRSTIKLLYGPGIAFPGLARLRDIVHMVCLYNILTDTVPPRARPGPPRPSSASGGPPAAARCGGVTNPTAEHRDAVGRSEVQ